MMMIMQSAKRKVSGLESFKTVLSKMMDICALKFIAYFMVSIRAVSA